MSRRKSGPPQPETPQAEAAPASLGPALRALRLRNGWTLNEVAQRTGLSISTLSKVENGRLSLTYGSLIRLSRGLSVDLAALFSPDMITHEAQGPAPSGRRSINRGGVGPSIEAKSGVQNYLAADLLDKKFVPMLAEIHSTSLSDFLADYGAMLRHPGEEFLYVVEGVLELHTEHYAPVRLEAGDSIYFDCAMGHAYLRVGTPRCRVLSICSPPSGGQTPINATDARFQPGA